jgi:hypothetical protein
MKAPSVAKYINKLIQDVSGIKDLYEKEKHLYNALMQKSYSVFKEKVDKASDSFHMAMQYAIAGNIIDFGQSSSFDAEKVIHEAQNLNLAIDHSTLLREKLASAETVLYLGDNTGEIVMDKLFIETINHAGMYFSTRGGNVLNDITREDAYEIKMNNICQVIDNGDTAPSTILEDCSESFLSVWEKADLVISKGQGNLEGLIDNKGKDIFFLLMAKCDLMAEILNVEKGNIICWYNKMK